MIVKVRKIKKEALPWNYDNDDIALLRQFRINMAAEDNKRKLLGIPKAKYDGEKGRVYLEYPDGRREYK